MAATILVAFTHKSIPDRASRRPVDTAGREPSGHPATPASSKYPRNEVTENKGFAACDRAATCHELRRSEARYRTLFEHARDGVVVMDGKGNLVQSNPAARSLLGRRDDELQTIPFRELLPASERAHFEGRLRELVDARMPHTELELVRCDGSHVPAEVAAARLPEGHFVLTLRDLSSRRRMEQALVQGEKLSAIGRIAAAVAHELRNPLFVISNVLYNLSKQVDLDRTDISDDLQMAAEENQRAREVIDNLLAFARPPVTGSCRLEPDAAIRQVVKLFRESLRQNHIVLKVDLRAPPPCYFHPNAFKQVMVNLLSNAMDAMPGGGRVAISAGPSPSGGAEVSITDTGRGMSNEEQKEIFTPFYSTKKEGHGTGLGLWIVHLTVDRYKGKVRVHSSEGAGTTFSLELAPEWSVA